MEKMVEMPETDDARVLKKGKFSPMRKATRGNVERVLRTVLLELVEKIGDDAFMWNDYRFTRR